MYPGVAMDNAVYMHTATELWTMQVKTYELVLVGEFKWPPEFWSDQMTDIAFDASGAILVVDMGDQAIVKQIKDQGQPWWGAGVCTVLKEK
ncbi:MAG: hypothetical protein FJ109_17870 [Deltaproteobacteria bacterium]|nr:hypothetical protein [Deltaproteobacteria bacterium]